MSKVIVRGPKRKVQRVFSRPVDTSISNTVENKTLYTSEDPVTLIRMRGDFVFDPVDNALTAPVRGEFVIGVNPRGQQVIRDPSTGELLDAAVPLEEIVRFPFSCYWNDTNGIFKPYEVHFDTKAMRKLKEADTIELYYIAATGGDIKFVGNVYLWFKE